MTEPKVLNLSNVKSSFFDQLAEYEEFVANPDNKDPEEIAQLRLNLIRAAKQEIEQGGSPEAKRWYGYNFISGENGFPVDIDKGIQYLNEAVIQRSLTAQSDLGDIYSGVWNSVPEEKIDFEKAIKHYEQCDNGFANYRIACIYCGNNHLKDIGKALEYARKADEHHGDIMAKCMMATYKFNGDFIARDPAAAFDMFEEVIQQEQSEDGSYKSWAGPSALFYIGLMTFNGEVVQRDDHRGFAMIEEAANYGDDEAMEWLQNYQR